MKRIIERCCTFASEWDKLGLQGAIAYKLARRDEHVSTQKRTKPFLLRSRWADHPLFCRPSTSDLDTFGQIFVDLEYSCVDRQPDVELVIDCGANVGYSSAYFLSKHPKCRVIAIEPDTGNISILKRNLAAYGERAKIIESAVWSNPTSLMISENKFRDGREWGRQVRECAHGEVGMKAVTIDELLESSGCNRISILKIDIEGAEAELFQGGCERWLKCVDTLLIEIHDDSHFGKCSDIFAAAISDQDLEISYSGE